MHSSRRFLSNFQMSFTSERPKQRHTKCDAYASWLHGHIIKFLVGTLVNKTFIVTEKACASEKTV